MFGVCLGVIHVVIRALEIFLSNRLTCLIQLVMQPVHRGKNVAADIQSLRLLLAANLVNAGQGGVGAGFEVGKAVMSVADFARRRTGWSR